MSGFKTSIWIQVQEHILGMAIYQVLYLTVQLMLPGRLLFQFVFDDVSSSRHALFCVMYYTPYSVFFWTRQTSHVVYLKIHRRLITARKRSLGQGNMFTGVCLSTGGCLLPGGAWPRGVCLLPGGCLHPGGGSAPGGPWSQGGVCSQGGPGGDPRGWLLLRVVRILLECILFYFSNLLGVKI